MEVKIKRLVKEAVMPSYAKAGDAGLDLTATSNEGFDVKSGCRVYGTGIAIEIPEGYVGLIFPRSSIADKTLTLVNSVGVIDSGYRGEIKVKFKKFDLNAYYNNHYYDVGDKIAQLIILPYPKIEFTEIYELSVTDRGAGGYGSTGN